MDTKLKMAALERVTHEVAREMWENGLHNHCIHGGALLIKILHATGFREAYPLTVGVVLHNDVVQQWLADFGSYPEDARSQAICAKAGGCSVLLGRGVPATEDSWAGHLVIIVPNIFGNRHAMLDAAITAADDPDSRMSIPPLCLIAEDEFVRGGEPAGYTVNGTELIYTAYPNDHSYKELIDWMGIEGLDAAEERVMARMSMWLANRGLRLAPGTHCRSAATKGGCDTPNEGHT